MKRFCCGCFGGIEPTQQNAVRQRNTEGARNKPGGRHILFACRLNLGDSSKGCQGRLAAPQRQGLKAEGTIGHCGLGEIKRLENRRLHRGPRGLR